METSTLISKNKSFSHFIFSEKENRILLAIALAGVVIQFIIFKLLYPFPDFFSDSYSYLFAAYAHLDVSVWPIGYSKFLSIFHQLTYSATALIGFQYFFLEVSALYFFFTIQYLYQPIKANRILLFLFLFFNPLFLYLSNYVNSDPLFAALSLFWFTQLLWIIHTPNKTMLVTHALLLFLCFSVRNNAYYYPIISTIAFSISKLAWKLKLTGIILPFFLLTPFIIYTRNAADKMTGHKQFSLFTGWQLANNALYMRNHIKVDSLKLPTPETKMLDKMAVTYFSQLNDKFDDYLTEYVANYFIREEEAPLKKFFFTYYKPGNEYSSIIAWGQASIIFEKYGIYLIKNNPASYFRYYLLRNTKNYFIPPLEKLEVYNVGADEVFPIAQYWFHFKNRSVPAISKEGQGKVLFFYPAFFFFINLFFIYYILRALATKKVRILSVFLKRTIILASSFWLLNMCFSIMATINVFRYQFVPMLVCFTFSLLLVELFEKKEVSTTILPTYARQ